MGYANVEKAVRFLGSEIVRRARLNLGVVRKRTGYRSTWKKSGKKWTPTSTKKVTSKRNSVATGKLQKSIRYELTPTLGLKLYYEKYGDYVQSGRKGKSKGAPVGAIAKWSKMKRLKPRDMATGKFIAKSKGSVSSMNFMVNRSMAYYGVPAYPFMDKAIEESYDKELDNIYEAFKKDVADGLDN